MNSTHIFLSVFFALTVSLFLISPVAAASQSSPDGSKIKIKTDFESARAVIALFDKGKVGDDDLAELFKLHGINAIIEKVSRFNSNVTANVFKSTLKQVIETGNTNPDPFRFMLVKNRLPQVRELLKRIERDPRALSEAVISQMSKYTDNSLQMDVTVYFLLGGSSNAFAEGDKNFYVGLQYFGNDYDGLKEEMAHELFHNAQAMLKRLRRSSSKTVAPRPAYLAQSMQFLDEFVDEATAVLVGNPDELKGEGNFSKFYQGLIAKNDDRMTNNFALFELMLFRIYNDRTLPANYFEENISNIGLSGIYDSPFYIMGYRMAQTIEKYKGREAIINLVGRSPTLFFKDYIEIYKKHSDPKIIRFTGACEEILLKLAQAETR